MRGDWCRLAEDAVEGVYCVGRRFRPQVRREVAVSDQFCRSVGHWVGEGLGGGLAVVEAGACSFRYRADCSFRDSVLLGRVRCTCFVTDSLSSQPKSKAGAAPFSSTIGSKDADEVARLAANDMDQVHEAVRSLGFVLEEVDEPPSGFVVDEDREVSGAVGRFPLHRAAEV